MFRGEWKGWLLVSVGWAVVGLVAAVVAVNVIARCGAR
jgi:hypothetical protein